MIIYILRLDLVLLRPLRRLSDPGGEAAPFGSGPPPLAAVLLQYAWMAVPFPVPAVLPCKLLLVLVLPLLLLLVPPLPPEAVAIFSAASLLLLAVCICELRSSRLMNWRLGAGSLSSWEPAPAAVDGLFGFFMSIGRYF